MSISTITNEDGGRQNIYAKEVSPRVIESYTSPSVEAEKVNGRWAMVGFIAALGAYATTGQIIPGIF